MNESLGEQQLLFTSFFLLLLDWNFFLGLNFVFYRDGFMHPENIETAFVCRWIHEKM